MGGGENLRSYVISAKIVSVVQSHSGGIEHVLVFFWIIPLKLDNKSYIFFLPKSTI